MRGTFWYQTLYVTAIYVVRNTGERQGSEAKLTFPGIFCITQLGDQLFRHFKGLKWFSWSRDVYGIIQTSKYYKIFWIFSKILNILGLTPLRDQLRPGTRAGRWSRRTLRPGTRAGRCSRWSWSPGTGAGRSFKGSLRAGALNMVTTNNKYSQLQGFVLLIFLSITSPSQTLL